MLATLIDKPFDSDEWIFEIKWDGYRVLAYTDKKSVNLYSRNHNSFNTLFHTILEALKTLKIDAILDGEVVALDSKGISRFELLQNIREGTHACYYYIFDLLYFEGKDLRSLPLIERKEILKNILKKTKSPLLRFSDHVERRGIDFFREVSKRHLEGIIGKKRIAAMFQKEVLRGSKLKLFLDKKW